LWEGYYSVRFAARDDVAEDSNVEASAVDMPSDADTVKYKE